MLGKDPEFYEEGNPWSCLELLFVPRLPLFYINILFYQGGFLIGAFIGHWDTSFLSLVGLILKVYGSPIHWQHSIFVVFAQASKYSASWSILIKSSVVRIIFFLFWSIGWGFCSIVIPMDILKSILELRQLVSTWPLMELLSWTGLGNWLCLSSERFLGNIWQQVYAVGKLMQTGHSSL